MQINLIKIQVTISSGEVKPLLVLLVITRTFIY
jgi:hypothetical protein